MTPCGLGKRWNLLWGAISALLVGLLIAGALSPNIATFAWVIAGFAALDALLIAAQIPRWWASGRFDCPDLVSTLIVVLCAESAATTALFVVGALVRSPVPLVAAAITLMGAVAVCDVVVAWRIRRFDGRLGVAAEASGEQIDEAQQDSTGVLAQGDGEAVAPRVAECAPHKRPVPARGWMARAVGLLWTLLVGLGMALSQWIAPIAVVGAMGVAVAASTGRLAKPASSSTSSSGSTKTYGADRREGAGTIKAHVHHVQGYGGETESHDPPPVGTARWNGPCGQPPSSDVSAEAVTRMVRLFDVESQLEPSTEGCIGKMEPHTYPGDYYVTTTGVEAPTGEALSFAVYSEKHGGVVVLEAARAKLEALIAAVGPVGGVGRYPHYKAGSGDYYLFRSALGIYMFIRESQAEPYKELPPGLVRAWYLLMVTLETWLWPSHPLPGPHGELIYEMWSPSNTSRPMVEVKLEPKSGKAYCASSVYYRSPRFEPSLAELVELSASA
ncbi:MAG: hypothetical protein ABR992_01730 [Solirubrobacteraceae bacterium]|jgi:hypothetical protein